MDRTERTAIWKGLNRMPYIGDGEMRDMKNLSSDAYPFITTRKGRKPYTFTTKIPSPEGEAYRDIERLPEPCEEERGNVYRLADTVMVSGDLYRYADGIWVKSDTVYSVTNTINDYTLYNRDCKTNIVKAVEETTPDDYRNSIKYDGIVVKYKGDSSTLFEKNLIYRYVIKTWIDWVEYDGIVGTELNVMPDPNTSSLDWRVRYTGETTEKFTKGQKYRTLFHMQGAWEEVSDYTPVFELPKTAEEGKVILWCGYGLLESGKYYEVREDISTGDSIYYIAEAEASDNALETTWLPYPNVDNKETVFLYIGPGANEFARCYLNKNSYDWKIVSHPTVERTVTLKDYLDNYNGNGLQKIIEIGNFNGDVAALILDGNGEHKLYYDEKRWLVRNVSDESGKKLVAVGNRLVVGESGSYLYIKESKAEDSSVTRNVVFTGSGNKFSYSINATNFAYGNGGDREKTWEAWGREAGEAVFVLYAPWGEGGQLKALYEELSNSGTDFSVYAKREGEVHKQYLTVTSTKLEEKKLILAWRVGDYWHYDYADVLTIRAEGARENFDWYRAIGDTLIFESTDPHYYDVVAWKKRLWGYNSNVLHGTVADIFNNDNRVEWNTGDNTYTEAISQPLWQGGNITGIAALMNGLVCFKEDCITIVTGNYPAVMSSNTIPCRGLPPENRRSVAVANECVYYLSTDGVYRFDGNIPRCISRDVKISGTDAVGASDGNKYWLSLKEDSGEYALYVYDINYGIWHKEDCTQAVSFVMLGGEMHMAVGTEIYNLNAPQEDVNWECELWYDEGTHRKKKYKEIIVRGKVGECELYLKPDDGDWKLIGAVQDKMRMKFIPFDCEELGIKLRGKGTCEIKSIDRTFEMA